MKILGYTVTDDHVAYAAALLWDNKSSQHIPLVGIENYFRMKIREMIDTARDSIVLLSTERGAHLFYDFIRHCERSISQLLRDEISTEYFINMVFNKLFHNTTTLCHLNSNGISEVFIWNVPVVIRMALDTILSQPTQEGAIQMALRLFYIAEEELSSVLPQESRSERIHRFLVG